MNKLQLKIYKDIEGLANISIQWNDLLQQSCFPNIFLTWEWVSTWLNHFAASNRLEILAYFSGKELVAIIPLYEGEVSYFKGLKTHTLRFIGDGAIVAPDYLGPIIKRGYTEEVTDILIDFFKKAFEKYWILKLSSVNQESEASAILIKKLHKAFHIKIKKDEDCPNIVLPQDYETFLNGISKKRKKRVKYELNRAGKKFDLRFKCFQLDIEKNEIFEVIREVYGQSNKFNTIKNGFGNQRYINFHEEIIEKFAQKKWMKFYVAYFNDEPVSYLYGYIYNKTFWFYQTSFKQILGKFSPGSVLLQHAIEDAIEIGSREFDFLRGEEEYKYRFNNQIKELHTIDLFQNKNFHFYKCEFLDSLADLYKWMRAKVKKQF